MTGDRLKPLEWDPAELVVDLAEVDLSYDDPPTRQRIRDQLGKVVLMERGGIAHIAHSVADIRWRRGRRAVQLRCVLTRWEKSHGVWHNVHAASIPWDALDALASWYMLEGDALEAHRAELAALRPA